MTDLIPSTPVPGGEFLFYQTEDGRIRLQVRIQDETAWLTQAQMAELFQTTIPNVSMHIRNIFTERELQPESVVKEFLTTAADGKKYATKFYNLDVIISVDWIAKLVDFLRLSGRDILKRAGKISREQAARKAELEFETFHRAQLAEPSQVEKDFEAAVKELKNLPAPKRKRRKTTADDADNTAKK